MPRGPLDGGATEQFLLKSDKPSSDRLLDDFFATFSKTVVPSGVWMGGVRAQRPWWDFHWGGTFALIKIKKNIYDKSSEIRTAVFNRISDAALIKFYDFLMRHLFESGAY